MSKRRIRSVFESNKNAVQFDYFENEAMTPDDKYFLITVDHSKEDYAANSNLWIRNNRKIFPKMKEKWISIQRTLLKEGRRFKALEKNLQRILQ